MQARIQAGAERGRQYRQTEAVRQAKRQGSTVREVSARARTHTQKRNEGREAGRQRLTERSKLETSKKTQAHCRQW
jgi:hypothetical protein